jgi:uncharacterized protein
MHFPTDDAGHPLAERFRAFIRNPPFPCVGAKSALSRRRLTVMVARDIASDAEDGRIYAALLAVIYRYRSRPSLFQSFAVLFEGPARLSEAAFEDRLWTRAQSLSDRDSRLGQAYDSRVSPDPANPHFSLSFGGEAFFLLGLHPQASRPARRFEAPALVFNLHDQFERLRSEGRYEGLRAAILERDIAWAGSANPMLARHGERSEACQYSGRIVQENWACPFSHRPAAGPSPDARDRARISADMRGGAFAI